MEEKTINASFKEFNWKRQFLCERMVEAARPETPRDI